MIYLHVPKFSNTICTKASSFLKFYNYSDNVQKVDCSIVNSLIKGVRINRKRTIESSEESLSSSDIEIYQTCKSVSCILFIIIM